MPKMDRRSFIGGSDARIIMGKDEAALLRLWREKRGELEPEDLSALTSPGTPAENPLSASAQVHSAAAASGTAEIPSAATANSGLKEIVATHE